MSRAHARRRPSLPDFFLGITEGLEEASTACIVESAVAAITNEVGFDVPAAPDDEDLAESLTDRDAPFIWRPEVLAEELDDEHESEGDAVLDPLIHQTINELLEMMKDDGEDGFEEGYRLVERSCGLEGSLGHGSSRDDCIMFP
ncbi:hypothetical protein FRB96_007862 [Tulasnella sp. 330]|nr:hypothetical protein FRB96_007862 [Tulasnella sp. 330]KAG8874170.1 hypothetical protein FRB97_006098 [Tulasnella sp. 331]